MKIRALSNQTLYDISIQYFGTADYAVDIALLNEINISTPISNGEVLELPALEGKLMVLNYYQRNNIKPATYGGVKDEPLVTSNEIVAPMPRRFNLGLAIVKAQSLQSLYDVSLAHYGTADYAIDIAMANNIQISEVLTNGQALVMPNKPKARETLLYMAARNITPATANKIRRSITFIYGFPEEFPISL
jgi:hypothetical protein